ncbi:hypothetical protein ACFY9N_01750 [Microbacterium sp. NPDC008134]|uniref:hypothetical protein n=1 Tax=Microbacterium sp. NPDC008134 TaxID=3364183 RepID=UPI0036EBB623
MTEEELFEQAREVNFAYKAPVADVQVSVFDGEWQIWDYGDAPKKCGGDQYKYAMTRTTPEGWRLDSTPLELAEDVAAWLDENGWSDIKTRGYSGEIADVVVEAEYPEKYVDLLIVDISPGEVFDAVTVSATSMCQPGSWRELVREQVPGFADNDPIELHDDRKAEQPTAPLSFGFNDDGTPRFWDDGE